MTRTGIVRAMTATDGDSTRERGSTSDAATIEEQLSGLYRHSELRTAELKEIAAQLPAVVGRRAMIRALVGDAARGDKREMVRRGWGRIRRLPRRAVNSVLHRFGRTPDR